MMPAAGAVGCCAAVLAGNLGRICTVSPVGSLALSGRGIAVNRNVPGLGTGRTAVPGMHTVERDGAVRELIIVCCVVTATTAAEVIFVCISC